MSVMVPVTVSQVGMTEVIFVNHGVKVNGQYYCDVLLSQQMLPAIKHVAERCLFTKQYVAYSEIGHFLCSMISQGKVVIIIIIIIIIKQENDYSDVRQLIAIARALYKIKLKTHMLIVQ